jgi:hypothetical protein
VLASLEDLPVREDANARQSEQMIVGCNQRQIKDSCGGGEELIGRVGMSKCDRRNGQRDNPGRHIRADSETSFAQTGRATRIPSDRTVGAVGG